jgi:2-dehydro-3-deoxyphosphogluconate aldolase/(4S)-4-hydroxy-2-oxoglutarate aldolase
MAAHARLEVLGGIVRQGLIPLTYTPDVETMKKLVTASYEGGSRLFEFTNRGDNAIWVFTDLVRHVRQEIPDLILGAGSILDAGTASLYMSSGADFIVGSVFNPDVAKVCNRRKVAYLPGCGTASEISLAEEHGVEIVKVFPGAAAGGPGFVSAILAPTPWTKVAVTGGVEDNPESINAWFKAGVTAVGMGSNLFKKAWITEGRYDQVRQAVASVLKWIRQARGEKVDYLLEHVGIHPGEQGSAREIADWYATAFGLRVVEGSSSFMLEGARGGRVEVVKAAQAGGQVHLAISVSDFYDAVADLRGRGFEVEDPPRVGPTFKSAFLKTPDPAGHRVHILWRKPQ